MSSNQSHLEYLKNSVMQANYISSQFEQYVAKNLDRPTFDKVLLQEKLQKHDKETRAFGPYRLFEGGVAYRIAEHIVVHFAKYVENNGFYDVAMTAIDAIESWRFCYVMEDDPIVTRVKQLQKLYDPRLHQACVLKISEQFLLYTAQNLDHAIFNETILEQDLIDRDVERIVERIAERIVAHFTTFVTNNVLVTSEMNMVDAVKCWNICYELNNGPVFARVKYLQQQQGQYERIFNIFAAELDDIGKEFQKNQGNFGKIQLQKAAEMLRRKNALLDQFHKSIPSLEPLAAKVWATTQLGVFDDECVYALHAFVQ